ncbi:MAG: Hsp20/alpha crystallin family protein [Methanomassiliicoccales archaeon]|nr:Hsp20/alpha crystallin family protein [Methanomassiliicoccales archaeon]
MDQKKHEDESVVPMVCLSPQNMLAEMDKMFDRLRFGIEDFWFPSIAVGGARVPMVDVRDAGNHYLVEAEIPGMTRENVEIELGEDSLDIKAKKEEEREETAEGYIRKERGSLSFYRRLPLPENVNRDLIEAKMEDGILRISIPKADKPEDEKRKVEIK